MKAIIPFFTTTYLFLVGVVLGDDLHISTADELISFSNNVNGGSTYTGITVFLDNDIDFSEATSSFTPIGTESGSNIFKDKYFRGTFDGQGHTISNLVIKDSLKHVGLFGYSTGMTVKNVVMGPTCTVESTFETTGDSAYFGGIIGECELTTVIASLRTV